MQHTAEQLTLSRRMDHQITLGFVVLIVLMASLIGHAVWHIADLKDRMRDIVEVRNLKIQLATDLQEASHNRFAALVHQVLATDEFERDDHFQQYTRWGYEVGKARGELKKLPMDGFEQASLAKQDALIAQIVVF
jgi:hypothetical protein